MSTSMSIAEYEALSPETTVLFRGKGLKFSTPTQITQARAHGLFNSSLPMYERETLRWINDMKPGSTLVDIGANVGMYSIFAATRGVEVLAIEPEATNYSTLVTNIRANRLEDMVTTVCGGMSDVTGPDVLHIHNLSPGQSCHALGDALSPAGNDKSHVVRTKQSSMAYRFDDLMNMLNVRPDHVKIDVDGIEHKVVKGMVQYLSSCDSIKSVLAELNPKNPRHEEVYTIMEQHGFVTSAKQIADHTIDSGDWAGTCNVIFYRAGLTDEEAIVPKLWPSSTCARSNSETLSDSIAIDIYRKIQNVDIEDSPTPHFVIEDVFSSEDYEKIMANIPSRSLYCPMDEIGWTTGASHREVFHYRDDFLGMLPAENERFMRSFFEVVRNVDLMNIAATRFAPWIPELASGDCADKFALEAFLTKDFEGYKISPHSDHPDRVLTLMFYLPRTDECVDSGTSLYVPRDVGFECPGPNCHPFEKFEEVSRVPFKPNTLFGFVKTRTSFHGVSPLPSAGIDRDILHVTLHAPSRNFR